MRFSLIDTKTPAIIAVAMLLSGLPGGTVAQTLPTFELGPDSAKLPRSGPNAWCTRPDVIKNILQSLNETAAIRNSGEKAIDFKNSTTTRIDPTKKTAACHGFAQLSNGQTLPGTFSIEVNAAGSSIWQWMNDHEPVQKQFSKEDMPEMPDDEFAFVDAVGHGGLAYEDATTDFAKGASRPMRATLVCAAVKSRNVKNWTGKLVALTTNNEGRGVVTIELLRGLLYIKTWNNSLSDIGSDTLVEPGSRLFSSLGTLNVSDRVRFSGEFLASKADCFKEASMSLQGSMKSPEYLMRFSTIEKIAP